jgi:hypothetical protein
MLPAWSSRTHFPQITAPFLNPSSLLLCSSLMAAGQRAMGSAAHGHDASAKDFYMSHIANRHPFHVMPPSPWPILAGFGAFVACLGRYSFS